MAEVCIFEERTLTEFAANSEFGGLYALPMDFGESIDAFNITQDETYRVLWDGTGYEVVAEDAGAIMEGCLFLGNGSIYGLSGNGEPFAIVWSEYGTTFLAVGGDTSTSHTIAIYHVTEELEVSLKDRAENDLTYAVGNGIKLYKPDGTTQSFIPGEAEEATVELDFSGGDMVVTPSSGKLLTGVTIPKPETLAPENLAAGVTIGGVTGTFAAPESVETTVAADFSAGDMEVTPEDGKVFSSVTVQKPATLIPGNIAKDVVIAGILGTLEGSGGATAGSWKFNKGYFKPTTTVATVDHGLASVPDLIIVWASQSHSNNKGLLVAVGFSDDACDAMGGVQAAVANSAGAEVWDNYTFGSAPGKYGQIGNVTETSFTVGGTTIVLQTGIYYNWIAIGGIFG